MATIGRSAAVGVFGRVKLQGFIAWLLWGGVHLFYVIGFRNRAAVLLDWIWAWLTYSRGARLITIPRNVEMETATASLPKTRSEHRPMVPTGATEREPASTT
jgi:hypothetical protein